MNVEPPVDSPAPAPPRRLDFEEAFVYLFRRPNGWRVILIGGILIFFSWLILPLLVVIGYGAALGRAVAADDENLPRFSLGMAADGLRAIVIMIGYFLPMFVLYAVSMVPLMVAEEGSSYQILQFFFIGSFGIFFLMMIYALGVAALQPAVFAVFIVEGTIGACFSPRRLKELVKYWGGSYAGAAAIVFGVSQLAGIGFILFIVGIVFTYFYLMAFVAHIAGQLARPILQRAGSAASTLLTG